VLYIKKASANTLKVTLKDKMTATVSTFKFKITNDIKQVEQEITITPTLTNDRFDVFSFTEPSDLALVDEGSYTYEITGDGVTLEKGKAIVYDGTYTTATKFGDEVTYTEHSNTETNTQYITI
jgi:hypothetical protein|tara:strand:+ start:617 stop:985 length:369 start_codon:yes stop_codon:yes gene_type:complete